MKARFFAHGWPLNGLGTPASAGSSAEIVCRLESAFRRTINFVASDSQPSANRLTCACPANSFLRMSAFKTVDEYVKSLPVDRRSAIGEVRKLILANLPKGYAERMQGSMIGYVVPHEIYPAGYHCDPRQPLQYAALASQKSHMAIHMMVLYGDTEFEKWLREAWQASGKKLDMGKSCIRFKKLDDLPLEVVAQAVARVPVEAYVSRVEKMLGDRKRKSAK